MLNRGQYPISSRLSSYTRPARPVSVSCKSSKSSLGSWIMAVSEACLLAGSVCCCAKMISMSRRAAPSSLTEVRPLKARGGEVVSPLVKNLKQDSALDPSAALLDATTLCALLLGSILSGKLAAWLSPRESLGDSVSLDAVTRLAKLEQSVLANKEALEKAERRLEKSNLRYRLYSSQVKQPLKQVQAGLEQQAEVLAKLVTALDQSKRQVEGNEQVLAALQAVAARQFQVTMQSIARLQEEQSSLLARTADHPAGDADHTCAAGGVSQPLDPWRVPRR